jgi:hypothetical protein
MAKTTNDVKDAAETTRTTTTNGANSPRQAAQNVAEGVMGAASEAVSRLPEAAQTTRGAVEEANRAMRAGSDEMLTAGTTLSVGLAIGLLIGGANRLLVIAALIPAAMMGFTLLDRSQGVRSVMKGN